MLSTQKDTNGLRYRHNYRTKSNPKLFGNFDCLSILNYLKDIDVSNNTANPYFFNNSNKKREYSCLFSIYHKIQHTIFQIVPEK